MGVIQRQGIKQSAAVLLGSIIGGLNNLYFLPAAFTTEQIGLLRVFRDSAMLLTPFILMGASGLTVRFFPRFENKENGHNGFLRLLLTMVFTGIAIFLLIFLGFKKYFLSHFWLDSPLVGEYYFYFIPVVMGYSLTAMLTQYSGNFFRLTIPSVVSQAIKLVVAVVAIAFGAHLIGFERVIQATSFWYLAATGILLYYIYWLGQLHLGSSKGFINKPLIKEMGTYAMYGFLASAGTNLIVKIDVLMLSSMKDLGDTGVYTTASYIASIIMIPTNALISISAPVIARSWHKNDIGEISNIYKKTSLNLSLIGLLFILLISTSLHDLFNLMPNGRSFSLGFPVVIILLLSNFFDMITSVNNEIIGYSKFFRMSFYATILVGLFNTLLNYLLIPEFGILGPAIATLISLFLYNLFKMWYIYKKVGIHPFSQQSLKVFVLGGLVFMISLIPYDSGYPLVNILVKSSVIGSVFVLLALQWNISPEMTQLVSGIWQKITRKK